MILYEERTAIFDNGFWLGVITGIVLGVIGNGLVVAMWVAVL